MPVVVRCQPIVRTSSEMASPLPLNFSRTNKMQAEHAPHRGVTCHRDVMHEQRGLGCMKDPVASPRYDVFPVTRLHQKLGCVE